MTETTQSTSSEPRVTWGKYIKLLWGLNLMDRLENITTAAAIVCVFGIMFITVFDVMRRYLFGSAVGWAYAFNCVLMVAGFFLALSRATKEGVHVQFGLIYERLRDTVHNTVQGIQYIAAIIIFALIGWQSGLYTITILKQSIIYSPEMPISAAPAYSIITIGCFLACLRSILIIRNLVVSRRKNSGKQNLEVH